MRHNGDIVYTKLRQCFQVLLKRSPTWINQMLICCGLNNWKEKDVDIVGGKSSSLGEMTSKTDVPVPYGFATTAHAYRYFIDQTGLREKMRSILAELTDVENSELLSLGLRAPARSHHGTGNAPGSSGCHPQSL